MQDKSIYTEDCLIPLLSIDFKIKLTNTIS